MKLRSLSLVAALLAGAQLQTTDWRIDRANDWTELKESYDYIPGFSKQIARTPAELDLSKLPASYISNVRLSCFCNEIPATNGSGLLCSER